MRARYIHNAATARKTTSREAFLFCAMAAGLQLAILTDEKIWFGVGLICLASVCLFAAEKRVLSSLIAMAITASSVALVPCSEIARRAQALFEAADREPLSVDMEVEYVLGHDTRRIYRVLASGRLGPEENVRAILEFPDLPWLALPQAGQQVVAEGRFRAFPAALQGFPYTSGWSTQGVWGTVRINKGRAAESRESVAVRRSEGRDLMDALSLGRRDRIGERLRDDFRQSGLSHLLAISGYHIGLVYLCCVMLFSWFLGRCCLVLQRAGHGRVVAAVFGLGLAFAYAYFCGQGPATARASIALTLSVLALAWQRRVFSFRSLALCATLLQVWMPGAVLQLGFLLSFSAVFGILVALRLTKVCACKRKRFLAAVAVASGAWCGSGLVMLFATSELAPLSVFFNVVFVSILSVLGVVVGGVVNLVSAASAPLGFGLSLVAEWLLEHVLALLRFLLRLANAAGLGLQDVPQEQTWICAVTFCSFFLFLELLRFASGETGAEIAIDLPEQVE